MKILIGYDGSDCADAAIEDLRFAGLPGYGDAIVLSIADVWPPPETGSLNQTEILQIEQLRQAARSLIADADRNAAKAAAVVQSQFPGWNVRSEATADSPGWGLIKRSDEWPADLVVVGSHGLSATDRLFIGSVSQKVLTHATCSVRVARRRPHPKDKPLRLLIGFDGSMDADVAVREVASRRWPERTQVEVLTVIDESVKSGIMSRLVSAGTRSVEGHDYEACLRTLAKGAVERLTTSGLYAGYTLLEGPPKRVLLETAEHSAADCIFVGATGLRGLRRLLLGSVSSAVAAHSPCTVEVVRARRLL